MVHALTCAVAWQTGVGEREAAFETDKQLRFRIGINIGDVIIEGDDLHGDGVNARYERGAMILTSNRGFKDWGAIFGDNVVAAALLDRLLHHAVVIQIDGNSYRLREHAALVPDNLIPPVNADTAPPKRRRGRPPKEQPRSATG